MTLRCRHLHTGRQKEGIASGLLPIPKVVSAAQALYASASLALVVVEARDARLVDKAGAVAEVRLLWVADGDAGA